MRSLFSTLDERVRRAMRSSAWHLGARLFATACAFTQVPSALRQLGAEGYGFVMAALAAGTLAAAVCDLGVGLALQTRLAKATGDADAGLRHATFWRGVGLASLLGSGWFILGALFIGAGRWAAWFDLSAETVALLPVKTVLLSAWAAACATIPAGLAGRLALAEQRHWINGAAACIGSVLVLLAILACEQFHATPAIAALLLVSSPLLPALVAAAIVAPRSRIAIAAAPPASRELLREGCRFLPSQIAAFWWTVVPPVALGLLVDAKAVTQFNLVQRLFSLLHQVQILVLQPFGPTLTEAQARGDTAWLKRCYRALSLMGGGGFALAAGLLAFGVFPTLRLWLGSAAPPLELGLLLACAAWNIVWLSSQPPTYLLTSLADTYPLTKYGMAGVGVSAGAMLLSAPHTYAVGVVTSMAATYALIVWPGLARAARRTLPA